MKNSFLELFNKCTDELKEVAFTHSSFANEKKIESNERLEFLGDSVLSTIVSDYLYKHYHKDEGRMTKIRASFVCTESLSELAKELEVAPNIKLGKSFKGKTISSAILADTIESMIGAMYLCFGLPSISTAVLDALKLKQKMKLGVTLNDYKSALQEYCQETKLKLSYKADTYLTPGGQENFRSAVMIDGQFVAYGNGSTKREAEQNAARLALTKLKS